MPPFKHVKGNHLVFEAVTVFWFFKGVVSLNKKLLGNKETAMDNYMPLSHFEALERIFQSHRSLSGIIL